MLRVVKGDVLIFSIRYQTVPSVHRMRGKSRSNRHFADDLRNTLCAEQNAEQGHKKESAIHIHNSLSPYFFFIVSQPLQMLMQTGHLGHVSLSTVYRMTTLPPTVDSHLFVIFSAVKNSGLLPGF